MATFVLTALALGNASKAAQQELRQSLGGSFLIGFDYTENNPYLKVESVEGGTLMYSTQQISPELVEQIREIEGIKECSATVEGLAAFPSLELFTGNIPIEEEFRASSKILSTWKSEELTRFTSGQLTLTQGRHFRSVPQCQSGQYKGCHHQQDDKKKDTLAPLADDIQPRSIHKVHRMTSVSYRISVATLTA